MLNFRRLIAAAGVAMAVALPQTSSAVVAGDMVTSGDLKFTVVGCLGDCGAVTIVGRAGGDGVDFQLDSTFEHTTAGPASDATVFVLAESTNAAVTIDGVTLSFDGTAMGDAVVDTVEQLFQNVGGTPGAFIDQLQVTVDPFSMANQTMDSTSFAAISSLIFSKDIASQLRSGTGSAEIDLVSQVFSTQSVPVPGALGFVAAGLVGVRLVRRARS